MGAGVHCAGAGERGGLALGALWRRLSRGWPDAGRRRLAGGQVCACRRNGRGSARTGVERAGAYRYAFDYLYEVLKRAGRLAGLKSRPDQADSEMTIESIIDARVIHGSPQTVAEQLLAFRQETGPFGQVLVTGMDRTGPNAAWERESMQRLAEEVMPIMRRQTSARAAE